MFSREGKPILGICGGLQSINVCFGGSLKQNIDNHDLKGKLHRIYIKDDTFLYSTYQNDIDVNSFHHQSIKNVAPNFKVSAISEDGTIEKDNIVGVQWHPEEMKDIKFFQNFLNTLKKK